MSRVKAIVEPFCTVGHHYSFLIDDVNHFFDLEILGNAFYQVSLGVKGTSPLPHLRFQ